MAAPPRAPAARSATRAERAAQTVRLLSREPRPAGGEAEDRAREHCAERLRRAGFDVHEEPFEYSAFPGRWGTSIGGVVALAIVLVASSSARAGMPGVALICLTLGAAAFAIAARALARAGVLRFPAARRRGVNLIATRPGSADPASARDEPVPAIWLMAHLDSKSQPVPILVRAAGITVLAIVWIAAIAATAAQFGGAIAGGATLWNVVAALAAVGAIPVLATTVGSRSYGALDNATGVATVLAAAEDAPGAAFGVCLTSVEELGLAGSRAWAGRDGRLPAVAINCDTVDDVGATTCMYSGRRPGALVASVLAAGSRAASVIRAHRLLPGVLTDGVALADAGWEVVTLSKGGVRTLARIHTPRDRADGLTGAGMDEVARVLVELVAMTT